MKSLINDGIREIIFDRLDHLTHESNPQWGKMNVSQMLKHCQFPLKVALGEEAGLKKPSFMQSLILPMFKASLYNDKEWKKGMRTAPSFKITEEVDFEEMRKELKLHIDRFYDKFTTIKSSPSHPLFGRLTLDQWGMAQYKHLDHHLRQFGV